MKNNDKLPINTRYEIHLQAPSINTYLSQIDWFNRDQELQMVLSTLTNQALEKLKMFAEVELRERDNGISL